MANDVGFTFNENPERDLNIKFEDIIGFLEKKYDKWILSVEKGEKGGKEHFHFYLKTDQMTKNFKKSFVNYFKLGETTKTECKPEQIKWLDNWVGYIAKDGKYQVKGLDELWVHKCKEKFTTREDKKKFKTVSRQNFLYEITKHYRGLKSKTGFPPDKLRFLAVRETLLKSKMLPPGLKLGDYIKISLNWEEPEVVHPFTATLIGRLLGQKCIDPEKEEFDLNFVHDDDLTDMTKIFNVIKNNK